MRYVSIALLLVASTANAENWQQIGKPDSNGGILLFDAARITEVKGLAAGTDNGTPVPESCLAFKIMFTVKK